MEKVEDENEDVDTATMVGILGLSGLRLGGAGAFGQLVE